METQVPQYELASNPTYECPSLEAAYEFLVRQRDAKLAKEEEKYSLHASSHVVIIELLRQSELAKIQAQAEHVEDDSYLRIDDSDRRIAVCEDQKFRFATEELATAFVERRRRECRGALLQYRYEVRAAGERFFRAHRIANMALYELRMRRLRVLDGLHERKDSFSGSLL